MICRTNERTGRKWVDLTGQVFGRWTVLECTGRTGRFTGKMHGQTTWRCRCVCGREKESVNYGALMGGKSQSCGCFRGEVVGAKSRKHGESGGKMYTAWQGAKMRCHNPETAAWENYGGRGIVVCDGFREDFVAWQAALGLPPSRKHSVDRRDTDGHYSCGKCAQCVANGWPLNVRWATALEQANNTRANRRLEWKGQMMTITGIARMENVAFCSLRNLLSGSVKLSVADAVQVCRSRGLVYKERAQCLLEKAVPSDTTVG